MNAQNNLIWEYIEAEKNENTPSGREGHCVIYLSGKNQYMIFGGLTDSNKRSSGVYTLDLSKAIIIK